MSRRAATATIDTDELPPTQYLIMEVLAARYRTGETTWTFPSRFRRSLEALADAALIGCKSGVAPRTQLAWLTDEGKAAALSDTYEPPGTTVTEQWAVRKSSVAEGEGTGLPYPTRVEAERALIRWLSTPRTYPVRAQLVRRNLHRWPDGKVLVGEWVPVGDRQTSGCPDCARNVFHGQCTTAAERDAEAAALAERVLAAEPATPAQDERTQP